MFGVHCFVSFLVSHLDVEANVSCFNLFVFLVSCDCYCIVALPQGAVGWSACRVYFLIILTCFFCTNM